MSAPKFDPPFAWPEQGPPSSELQTLRPVGADTQTQTCSRNLHPVSPNRPSDLSQNWETAPRMVPFWAKFGRNRPKSGRSRQIRSRNDASWSRSPEAWSQAPLGVVEYDLRLVRHRRAGRPSVTSTQVWSKTPRIGPLQGAFCEASAGRNRPKFARKRANVGRLRAKICRSNSRDACRKFRPKLWTRFGRRRPK